MSLTSTELSQIIARVKQAMPRNADVMAICEALEGMLLKLDNKSKFDRTAYQRELMRKRRAEGKA